jgi:hypothetical protein
MSTNKLLVTRSNEKPRALSANETPLEDPNFIVVETKRSLFSLSLFSSFSSLVIELFTILLILALLVEVSNSGNSEWMPAFIWALIGLVATFVTDLFTTTEYKRFIEDYSKKFREPLSSAVRANYLLGLYEILNCTQPREWGVYILNRGRYLVVARTSRDTYVNILINNVAAWGIVDLALSVVHLHSLHYTVHRKGAEVTLSYIARRGLSEYGYAVLSDERSVSKLKKTHYVLLDGKTRKLKLSVNFSEGNIAILSPYSANMLLVGRGVLVSARATISVLSASSFFGVGLAENLVKLTMLISEALRASIKYCEEVLSKRGIR